MPTLTWTGKEKVINHHQEVPFRVLEHRYGFNASAGQTNHETGSGNKIIHGDNLLALKTLLPEYEGRIKCIYIDPPYNTGNESWVYNDNVNDPKIKKWLGEVVGKEGEDLNRHDKWLCMMYPRLKLLYRLLSEDGVIFISVDDNEQANLKLVMDDIFGVNNYITSIIWQKRKGGGNDSFFIAVDHEYISVYTKNKSAHQTKWRVSYDDEYLKRYKEADHIGRFYWDTLSRAGLNNPIVYDIICPDNSVIKNGTWQISEKSFLEKKENGDVKIEKNRNGTWTVFHKVRMPEGKVFRSIVSDVTNKNAADEMELLLNSKKAFSNPKPEGLISGILDLIEDKDSIILDSFAGSGTTAHAVLSLNKQDGGNRKFILVEMEDYAETITAERVRRVMKGYNSTEGTGGEFDYYELGQPLFRAEGELNEDIPVEKIRNYVFYTETKRPLIKETDSNNPYFLEKWKDTGYYFYYEKDRITTLDPDFLATIDVTAEQHLIYADKCLLDKDFLANNQIIFKKIPRDITRF